MRYALCGLLLFAALSAGGCAVSSRVLNPFYEDPAPEALLGERNDSALSSGGRAEDTARAALQSMATYQRAQLPQPVNPVMRPAVVRLMWIPDHLNKNGDLVPAHFYYLKVKKEDWAVSDAFELESQLNGGRGGASSHVPFVLEEEARKERLQ